MPGLDPGIHHAKSPLKEDGWPGQARPRRVERKPAMTDTRCETLKLETPVPGVLVVTLNRPEVRNAISTKMGGEMLDVFTRLNADPAGHRCVVLTGAGDRAFCAGGDLKERHGMTHA